MDIARLYCEEVVISSRLALDIPLAEMVELANQAYHGIARDGDEQVDPVPGKAGALTAYLHAPLMGALQLKPGASAEMSD